ncbi:Uncharacterised protein [Mycobacteroides abscessus subsp. massiliense]|uniref:hypothetical protein n=1 Tax=Mycobacteroides abscessus TaxID=36809 RepID=UPI000927193D|nr:hypothetical protein [Mycobacteroides abscessus]SHX44743.1 Uncharacterised protein [Mycobacteroides abscessus subsp. abscessus]SKM66104.1 Uncharacterised protein [Mycobacteroides abscessus subsp. massiliense]SKN32792.1 Uncharacterised protein [Mycobacteroides abscessus subsp. massiliense]SKP14658.1 Uncharacterised protein [Mycobacteroides abscessus subsp. massiliense]SKP59196.1 Uncharacterised protein [Mycobacteroides abscessus subsp. massiliense]
MTVLLDPAGTSRKSTEGVYAVCVAEPHNAVTARWMLSKPNGAVYWAIDADVADWKVVYKPPVPVGRLYYRTTVDGDFEVAVQTRKGLMWVESSGHYFQEERDDDPPYDDEDGKWTIVQLGGVDGTITDPRGG